MIEGMVRKDTDVYRVVDYISLKLTLSTTVLYPNKETNGHRHPHYEMYYIMKGMGKIQRGMEITDIVSGSALSIGSGLFHKVWNTGEGNLEFICAWENIDIDNCQG